MTSRSYCFTSFNVPELLYLCNTAMPDLITYLIMQLEEAPSTGIWHMQGYMQLKAPARYTQVKTILQDESIHLEKTKGLPEQARDYCKKKDSRICGPWEYGTFKSQGYRNDMHEFIDELYEKPMITVALGNPTLYCKYYRGFEKIKHMIDTDKPAEYRKLNVFIRWGIPDSGKTRYVYDNHPHNDIFKLKIQNGRMWWDGYYAQKTILLDDFYGDIKLEFLLDILDGYPKNYEVKGGHVIPNYNTVYFTSNKNPAFWYGTKIPASLKRRITTITEVPFIKDCHEVLEGNTNCLEPDQRYGCLTHGLDQCFCD